VQRVLGSVSVPEGVRTSLKKMHAWGRRSDIWIVGPGTVNAGKCYSFPFRESRKTRSRIGGVASTALLPEER